MSGARVYPVPNFDVLRSRIRLQNSGFFFSYIKSFKSLLTKARSAESVHGSSRAKQHESNAKNTIVLQSIGRIKRGSRSNAEVVASNAEVVRGSSRIKRGSSTSHQRLK